MAASGDPTDYFSWSEHDPCGQTSPSNVSTTSTIKESEQSTMTSTTSTLTGTVYSAETYSTNQNEKRKIGRSHPKRLDDPTSTSITNDPGPTSAPIDNSGDDWGWTDSDIIFEPKGGRNDAKKMSSAVIAPSTYDPATSTSTFGSTPTSSPNNGSSCFRDGRDDNAALFGPRALDRSPQGVLDNVLSYTLTNETKYLKTATSFLETFFVSLPIQPSAIYAGTRRDTNNGTMEGLLDFRGLVKIANSLLVLRETSHMDEKLDQAIKDWSRSFLTWMEDSEQGKNASLAMDHGGTMYHMELASLALMTGNGDRARDILDHYFERMFPEQLDRDGKMVGEDGYLDSILGLEGMMVSFYHFTSEHVSLHLYQCVSAACETARCGVEAVESDHCGT